MTVGVGKCLLVVAYGDTREGDDVEQRVEGVPDLALTGLDGHHGRPLEATVTHLEGDLVQVLEGDGLGRGPQQREEVDSAFVEQLVDRAWRPLVVSDPGL